MKHVETGQTVKLKRKGGSYVLRVEFIRRKTICGEAVWEGLGREEVTVDSGAEESVCPVSWGVEFRMTPVVLGREMKMVNAGGGELNHYRSRKITITTGFF